ncbi:alpha beta-hydrolase [Lentinula edodes]|uniref:Alpha beta-hydrolase n=1 Tax=Lentinula edodes TaxID=5353 RepID=A0A1Q3EIG1_LENED|nr:alpha beta-hydrolase [Lentinula edodes]
MIRGKNFKKHNFPQSLAEPPFKSFQVGCASQFPVAPALHVYQIASGVVIFTVVLHRLAPAMFVQASWSLVALAASAFASPAARAGIQARTAITTLTTAQIEVYKPYTYYASAGYCSPTTTINWSCGTNCEANPTFVPVASGGDGDSIQFWFVGYDPTLHSVIVSHQGTDTAEILSIVTDVEFALKAVDSTLFPGVSSSVEVHDGFGKEQAQTATAVLAAVKKAMSAHSTTTVTTTGHSLGAAISLLDALYLSVQVPTATVNFIGYGLPRVGNQAFANLMDSKFPNLVHINNKEDIVPIVPGRLLGYVHPSGEKHILDSNAWVACPGQDNTSTQCSTGDVPTILSGDVDDHFDPTGLRYYAQLELVQRLQVHIIFRTFYSTFPPQLKFESPQVEWKGLPLDGALWTLDSKELQTIVSRAIRSSAQESFIRLLPLKQLDEVLPAELERLNFQKASMQSRYRFHVQRRTMLLQALVSWTSSTEKDGGIDLVSKLATQISDTTAECDKLTQELVSVVDQINQVTKLIENHWASALAIALRKLNGSYGKRTAELIEAKTKLGQLQAELNDAWSEAEKLAEEMDGLTRELDDIDDTGVYSDEGEIFIRTAAVVTVPKPASHDAVSASGKLIDLKPSNVASTSSQFLRPPSAVEPKEGEDSKSSPEDNDTRSLRSRRSARSGKSSSRVGMITAARTRSMRTSLGSLRLPGRSSRSIHSPSGIQSAPVDGPHPPVPSIPKVFTPDTSHPPSSNSLTPTSNAPHSSTPSPLDRKQSRNISTESLVDEPAPELPPPPSIPILSPAPQPRLRKTEIEDIRIEPNRRLGEPSAEPPLSVMDDIIVMPTSSNHGIEEVPRILRKSVDDVNMSANSQRKMGRDPTSSTIPSIWLHADAPKTPAERVEALMRSSSQKTSYTKLKGLTKRYSLPFQFHGRNSSTSGSHKSGSS